VIPLFDPRTEERIEYEVTRAIHRVAHPKRSVLGVLSALPVLGRSAPMLMPGAPQQGQEPWISFRDIGEDYDVRELDLRTESVPDDIDAVVVVHPRDVPDSTLFALDQFVLRGGRLLVFVDPLSVVDMETRGQRSFFGGPDSSSDLAPLFEAWGITYDPGKVVADLRAVTLVQGRRGEPESSPVYLSLAPANFNPKEMLVAGMDSILMPFAGSLQLAPPEGLEASPLLVTSEDAARLESMMAQFGGEAIRRQFKKEGASLILAARLHGRFRTAFPDGPPAATPGEAGPDAPPHMAESVRPNHRDRGSRRGHALRRFLRA
jgi:ABC-type uncharacterized transport system involved in gliding motility auxiliary subunit